VLGHQSPSSVTTRHLGVILALLLLASWATRASAQAGGVELEVVNGAGDGRYPIGAIAHVWADASGPARVLTGWEASADVFTTTHESHMTLVVPSEPVVVTATFRAVEPWSWSTSDIAGVRVAHHVPPQPVGVIMLHHFAGGDAADWTGRWTEMTSFARNAVSRGYGVAAIDSAEPGQWAQSWTPESLSGNPDVARVRDVLDGLTEGSGLRVGVPRFAVGMSDGGLFASLVAHALGFRGAAVYQRYAYDWVAERTGTPMAFVLAQRDTIADTDRATASHRALSRRGVHALLIVNGPWPLYRERFQRIDGIDSNGSSDIYNGLEAAGLLDPAGYLLAAPRSSAWRPAIPPAQRQHASLVREQLDVAWSDHRFTSDADVRVLDFFDGLRTDAPVTPSPTPIAPTAAATAPTATADASTPAPARRTLYLPRLVTHRSMAAAENHAGSKDEREHRPRGAPEALGSDASVDIFDRRAPPLLEAGTGFGDAGQEPRVVLEAVLEPVVLRREAHEHSDRLPVPRDHHLLLAGELDVLRQLVFHDRQWHLDHSPPPYRRSHAEARDFGMTASTSTTSSPTS
jgi:dienelactone hydrolase